MRGGAKPVIKVYLLPAEWGEEELQRCFYALLAGAQSVNCLKVETEDDFIVVFPKDAMMKGLGTEILVEVDVPASLLGTYFTQDKENEIASTFFEVMRRLLPEAHIQCKVYKFETSHGFCVSGVDD